MRGVQLSEHRIRQCLELRLRLGLRQPIAVDLAYPLPVHAIEIPGIEVLVDRTPDLVELRGERAVLPARRPQTVSLPGSQRRRRSGSRWRLPDWPCFLVRFRVGQPTP